MIEVRGLVRREGGRDVLGPLDLTIASGERLAVIGPNGAGKTTLLRCLAGLREPSAGTISIDQTPTRSMPRRELARRIAYVPQVRPARVPLSVREIVLLGRYPYLSPFQLAHSAADYAAAEQALVRVGIADLAERPLDELSGGERQMAYIAAAIAQGGDSAADLLILDEPTTHLDPRHQRDIAGILETLARERGTTLVFATHDLGLAAAVADRALALASGRIFALGTIEQVLDAAVLQGLFGAPFAVSHHGGRPRVALDLSPQSSRSSE
mgnify:CR=1 FL=1